MNYLSNQRAITLFAHLFDQSACYYSSVCTLTQPISVLLQFSLFMATSKSHNTRLITQSLMELSTVQVLNESYDYSI